MFPASFRSITKLYDMDIHKVNLIHNTNNISETKTEMEQGLEGTHREKEKERVCFYVCVGVGIILI